MCLVIQPNYFRLDSYFVPNGFFFAPGPTVGFIVDEVVFLAGAGFEVVVAGGGVVSAFLEQPITTSTPLKHKATASADRTIT